MGIGMTTLSLNKDYSDSQNGRGDEEEQRSKKASREAIAIAQEREGVDQCVSSSDAEKGTGLQFTEKVILNQQDLVTVCMWAVKNWQDKRTTPQQFMVQVAE